MKKLSLTLLILVVAFGTTMAQNPALLPPAYGKLDSTAVDSLNRNADAGLVRRLDNH